MYANICFSLPNIESITIFNIVSPSGHCVLPPLFLVIIFFPVPVVHPHHHHLLLVAVALGPLWLGLYWRRRERGRQSTSNCSPILPSNHRGAAGETATGARGSVTNHPGRAPSILPRGALSTGGQSQPGIVERSFFRVRYPGNLPPLSRGDLVGKNHQIPVLFQCANSELK